ncbi:TetR/AcrR family transcriptional regulator [Streptomyces calidiresistens]|uniref:TetR family transcriptional regulator n=1 Tax=Streptomyces calidiresistens TaxID=1485586 RepID=A0A7W3XZB0_9ACTN|nr:TetR/AcrR family transcriptional regulator [Streptomyces calidiresistens]MBB0232656.1 TetR family transcriptional regulator [Streptomyces calidiresistens]
MTGTGDRTRNDAAEPGGPGREQRSRHRARGEERRGEILGAALEVIAERGYRGATLGTVAERVGITQQGLLHYFPTKESLLIEVLRTRDEWDTGGAVSREGFGDAPWPLANLETLVEYNAMRRGVVQTFSALLGESVTENHPAGEYFRDRYRWARAGAEATLRQEFGDRLPNGLTPERAAPLLIAVMDGLQFQWLHEAGGTGADGGAGVDMGRAFRDFLDLLHGTSRDPGGD